MDSRAKQRLTGAVILVALFVLLVPELLTGPRNAGGDAPNEEGMRRYTIDLDAARAGDRILVFGSFLTVGPALEFLRL